MVDCPKTKVQIVNQNGSTMKSKKVSSWKSFRETMREYRLHIDGLDYENRLEIRVTDYGI